MYTTAQLIGLIMTTAGANGIDPAVAVAQLRKESVNFAPYYVYGPGVSPKGAAGIAQFMPDTGARFGLSLSDRFNPDRALPAWAMYMRQLLGQFNGRYDLALAAYNWGENRTALQQALVSGQSILKYSIPTETRNYVTGILDASGYSALNPIVSTMQTATPTATDSVGGNYLLDFGSDSVDGGLGINWQVVGLAAAAAVVAALVL